jgi:hypothetical protein
MSPSLINGPFFRVVQAVHVSRAPRGVGSIHLRVNLPHAAGPGPMQLSYRFSRKLWSREQHAVGGQQAPSKHAATRCHRTNTCLWSHRTCGGCRCLQNDCVFLGEMPQDPIFQLIDRHSSGTKDDFPLLIDPDCNEVFLVNVQTDKARGIFCHRNTSITIKRTGHADLWAGLHTRTRADSSEPPPLADPNGQPNM